MLLRYGLERLAQARAAGGGPSARWVVQLAGRASGCWSQQAGPRPGARVVALGPMTLTIPANAMGTPSLTTGWVLLVVAGLLEACWAVGLG